MCDSVIPDSIAAAGCLRVEQAAEQMKRKTNPSHGELADGTQT